MRDMPLMGARLDLQGAAKAGPAIPGLERGNPAQGNRQLPPPQPGQAPGAPAQTGPVTNEQVRQQIQDALRGRGRGDPQINIPADFVRNAVPQGAVDISIAMFVTLAFVIVGLPFARAFARRMDRRSDALASGASTLAPQIEQLQQSVDALAIEMERITEAQRFQSKLMAGRGDKAEEPAKLAR